VVPEVKPTTPPDIWQQKCRDDSMPQEVLDQFAALIEQEQDALILEWRERARRLPSASGLDELALEDAVGNLLDEIASSLMADEITPGGRQPFHSGPMHHAEQRHELGFNIAELVVEYTILREVLQEFAQARGLALDGRPSIVLHRVIDAAISASVQAYQNEQMQHTETQIEEKLSDLVHELKTPLSAAHTAAILLETKLSHESRLAVGTMVRILIRNCERLESLVLRVIQEDLRQEHLKGPLPELDAGVFPLRPLVEGVIENMKSIAEKEGVSFRNEVPDDLYVFGDDYLLAQVFQNLISNAVKYTPKGQVTIGAESSTDRTRMWVKDTGKGIEPRLQSRIFERHVGDPTRPGSTGLGLAIVRQIVEAHRGWIHVESEVGRGSTFTIEIPPLPPAV
jgi:signal transduction histidine kinase